jgi:hypothetical protein
MKNPERLDRLSYNNMSKSLISPFVRWLIIIFLAIPFASAAIDHTYDLVGAGTLTADQGGQAGRVSVGASGDMAVSQKTRITDTSFDSLTMIDAEKGSLRGKTPEYDGQFRDVSGLKGTMHISRSNALTEDVRSEEIEGETWQITASTRKTFAAIDVNLSGNGAIDEALTFRGYKDRPISYGLDYFGNFSYQSKIGMSGIEMWETAEKLPSDEGEGE